jgi:hypothetical protein
VNNYYGSLSSTAEYTYKHIYESDPDQPGREEYTETDTVGHLLLLPGWEEVDAKQFDDGSVMQGSYTINGYQYEYNLRAMREGAE